MGKQHDNELRGVLFKNDDKSNEKAPDYSGSCQINGVEYFMDAWLNAAQSGRKYMSFRFNPKKKQNQTQQSKPSNDDRRRQSNDDDGAPW